MQTPYRHFENATDAAQIIILSYSSFVRQTYIQELHIQCKDGNVTVLILYMYWYPKKMFIGVTYTERKVNQYSI